MGLWDSRLSGALSFSFRNLKSTMGGQARPTALLLVCLALQEVQTPVPRSRKLLTPWVGSFRDPNPTCPLAALRRSNGTAQSDWVGCSPQGRMSALLSQG